jgi:glycine/D-amino acid oxidase-like deaminating enzyme
VKRAAEVVIIGAGITGCSIAYHLAERGVRDVVVLDKDQIGRGATADAAGGIRLQFSTRTNIELSRYSLGIWENFKELFGIDIAFHQQGYLFLLTSEAEVADFRSNLAFQQSLDVPVRWVDPTEIGELNPALSLDGIVGGTFCTSDGWADPYSSTMGFAQRARSLGVEIIEETPVTGFVLNAGRVTGVETPAGRIDAGSIVIAAGAYAGGLGKLAGADIPVAPFRRMSFVTEPFSRVPRTVPMTIEFGTSLYFHPESGGFLFGMSDPDEPSSFRRTVDDEWMAKTVTNLCRRAPVFEEARVLRGWAGLYEITPDDNPVLGYVPGVDGLVVASGFSGHGYMQGPAIGRCISELIVDGAPSTVDITAFSPGRFERGELAQEHNVV